MREQLTAAIEQRKIVEFTYQGHPRVVQPAAYGMGNRKRKETLHGYQFGGSSQRGFLPHWRNFHVEGITGLVVKDEVFGPNPPGYQPQPFPETYAALAPASGGSAPTGGGGDKGDGGVNIGNFQISEDQAKKAADVANKAIGMIGKWFKKR